MKLFKKLTNPAKVKSFIPAFVFFFLMNNLIAVGSENKLDFPNSKNDNNKIEEKFFTSSIPYSAYDNFESHVKIFFVYRSDRNESSLYQDLSINNTTDSISELYRSTLNDMVQK